MRAETAETLEGIFSILPMAATISSIFLGSAAAVFRFIASIDILSTRTKFEIP